jgi:hypothetical protein
MRTLAQLDAEIEEKAKTAAADLANNPANIMTESEIVYFQTNARFCMKYREMYSILQTLEEYLKYNSLDGKQERQPLRKKLKEMLEAL